MDPHQTEKILKIALEMLRQRGYNDIEKSEDGGLSATNPEGGSIIVLDPIENLNKPKIKEVIQIINENKYTHVIIVYKNSTPDGRNTSQSLANCVVELFKIPEMLFNPTKHVRVPKHEKLDEKRLNEFLTRPDHDKYPRILTSDRIARFYRFVPGDVIKITRSNGEIGWRICVEG